MSRLVALVSALLCVSALTAAAQPRTAFPEKRGHQLSEFPRVVRLADNVYGYEEIRQPGFTTVSLFVVGADGVLVADGQGSPAATQAMLDHIRKVTPRPVKWYVVGSDHGDHTAGNSVLPKDITFIVHPTSKAQLERDAANPSRNASAPPVVVPPAAMTGDRQVVDVGGIEARETRLVGRGGED
jgi:glyoxylase-like metal-dependent hydrolase (beta-lactamase superfamily II)